MTVFCNLCTSVFKITKTALAKDKEWKQHLKDARKCTTQKGNKYDVLEIEAVEPFPPKPSSTTLGQQVISGFCKDSSPESLVEGGCAVCGQLTPRTLLTKSKSIANQLHILHSEGGT